MSLTLRILLILMSFITAWFVLRRIKKSQMQIEDSLFWIISAVILVVVSIFPQIPIFFSKLLGIASPSNFVFVAIIFILLVRLFTLSMKVSQLENKLYELTERYGVDHSSHNQ